MKPSASFVQRIILPGLAFKAFVIGGGYATGRELAEFFFPAGPVGGLLGLALTAFIWSAVCTLTFYFAYLTRSENYRTFFRNLLGRFWIVFEAVYILFILLVLAVFGAAAGAIVSGMTGLPEWTGTLGLALAILAVTMRGNSSVEGLFKYASIFLYLIYAAFAVLALNAFGDRIADALAASPPPDGWAAAGITYAGYNVLGAVVILPVARHFTSRRDALTAGALCGPLAILPAFVFFFCMIGFYPEIGDETLPSNYILSRLGLPAFHIAFQAMIFVALLETSASAVNALNERIAEPLRARGAAFPPRARLAVTAALLLVAMVVADRFGLIALIANGYRMLAYAILTIFVAPLFTIGLWKATRGRNAPEQAGA